MRQGFFERVYLPSIGLVLIVFFVQMACSLRAQDTKPVDPKTERHMEQVKWDTSTKHLTAVVSEGRVDGAKYVPEKLIDYEIDLASGTVTVNGEQEHFSRYEGELVWRMVDLVVNYAGESVLWFDATHKPAPKQEAKR